MKKMAKEREEFNKLKREQEQRGEFLKWRSEQPEEHLDAILDELDPTKTFRSSSSKEMLLQNFWEKM